MPTTTTPAWLHHQRTTSRAPSPTPVTSPAQPPTPHPTSRPASPPTPQTRSPASAARKGNPSRSKPVRSAGSALLDLVETDVEALADELVRASTRPEAAALIRPDLPKMLRAMLAGAHVPGPGGMGERANAFRLAGLPTDRPTGTQDDGKARLGDLAARIEKAVGMRAKVVEAALGQESGTVAAADAPDAAESLRFEG